LNDKYYKEYDVPDPLQPDRGSFRIIEGEEGELYVTNNHYESFTPLNDAAEVALGSYQGDAQYYDGPYGVGQLVLETDDGQTDR
jgi:hypothetical protein